MDIEVEIQKYLKEISFLDNLLDQLKVAYSDSNCQDLQVDTSNLIEKLHTKRDSCKQGLDDLISTFITAVEATEMDVWESEATSYDYCY